MIQFIVGPGGLLKPKNGMFYTEEEKRNVLAITKLVGGAVSAYVGGNAQTAIITAEVAVSNNAFFVVPLVKLLAVAAGTYTTGVGGGNPAEGLKKIWQRQRSSGQSHCQWRASGCVAFDEPIPRGNPCRA